MVFEVDLQPDLVTLRSKIAHHLCGVKRKYHVVCACVVLQVVVVCVRVCVVVVMVRRRLLMVMVVAVMVVMILGPATHHVQAATQVNCFVPVLSGLPPLITCLELLMSVVMLPSLLPLSSFIQTFLFISLCPSLH